MNLIRSRGTAFLTLTSLVYWWVLIEKNSSLQRQSTLGARPLAPTHGLVEWGPPGKFSIMGPSLQTHWTEIEDEWDVTPFILSFSIGCSHFQKWVWKLERYNASDACMCSIFLFLFFNNEVMANVSSMGLFLRVPTTKKRKKNLLALFKFGSTKSDHHHYLLLK